MKQYPGYQGAADVLFYTGMSYKNLGDAERAVNYLSLYVDKYPSHKLAKDAKKELSSLNKK
jgi:TolA-binding protein